MSVLVFLCLVMDCCVNLNVTDNSDSSLKVIVCDGLIGNLPNGKSDMIQYLCVPDGDITQVTQKAFEFIQDNPQKKIMLLISAGSFNSFTFNKDEYSNAPQCYLDKLLDNLKSEYVNAFHKLTVQLAKCGGKLLISTLIPMPFMLDLEPQEKKFISDCFLSLNDVIIKLNKSAKVPTPFLREVVEYRSGFIPNTKQNKFGHKKHYVDKYHLNSAAQQKMMDKCIKCLDNLVKNL